MISGLILLDGCCELTEPEVNDSPIDPINLTPVSGAIDLTLDTDLGWDCNDPNGDPVVYDVYFGTSNTPPLIASGQAAKTFDPGNLDSSLTYYWKIVAFDDWDGVKPGQVWSFRTVDNQNPGMAYNPVPADSSENLPLSVTLFWSCEDPEGDPLTYDVYFGSIANPPVVNAGQTDTSYVLPALDFGTTYYWKIVSLDDHGNSVNSDIWEFTTLANVPPVAPHTPAPVDNELDVLPDVDLTWICSDFENDPIVYDVYFGEAANPPLVVSDAAGEIYDPGLLTHSRTYHWKVVAKDNFNNVTEGPIWTLTTSNQPPQLPVPTSPVDMEPDIVLNAQLQWSCVDPDGDPLTYDVYFGVRDSVLLRSADQAATTFSPAGMVSGQRYFWRIDAKDDHNNVTEGDVWTFTTIDPAAGAERDVLFIDNVWITVIWIPAGEFDMGTPPDEVDREDDEGPVHHVVIQNGFWMAKYELTQEKWEVVMGNNPAEGTVNEGANKPVINVSWNEVGNLINAVEPGYRLASESEWEYACRAGSSTRFYWGDDLNGTDIDNFAYYSVSSNRALQEVGQLQPNAFGLYDMSGNVWEFTEDDYHLDYNGAPADGSAWVDAPRTNLRVCKGASFLNPMRQCRSGNRVEFNPGSRHPSFGIRLVYTY